MSIAWRNQHLPSRLTSSPLQTLVIEFGRWMRTFVTEGEGMVGEKDRRPSPEIDYFNMSTWKVVDSRAMGIKGSSISPSTWRVLRMLQKEGFRAYLVGGCVRDLLLRRTPKDFDVVTTASLQEVKRRFHRAIIIGRRFPICRVYIKGCMVEVSSFETTSKNAEGRKPNITTQMASICDDNTLTRWRNCLYRDFTINSLFYDPCTYKIYDYVGGIRDVMTLKVRTVIPAHSSFEEDSARILRGLRIAARLGLIFSKETAVAIRDLSSSVLTLDKQRLMMEMDSMMAYGAAAPSICLLHKFKLLKILLPIHAVYLSQLTRSKMGLDSNMLMRLLSSVDKLLSADRPSDCSLLALLAFHLALFLHPQDALVVWSFSSLLYHGGWKKAVENAKGSAKAHVHIFPEIRNPSGNDMDDSLSEEVSHLASLVKSSISAFVDPDALVMLMAKHLRCDVLGLPEVYVSQKVGKTVADLFTALETDIESYKDERKSYEINYDLLKQGDQNEIRFVLGKVIMDAMTSSVMLEKEQEGIQYGNLNSTFVAHFYPMIWMGWKRDLMGGLHILQRLQGKAMLKEERYFVDVGMYDFDKNGTMNFEGCDCLVLLSSCVACAHECAGTISTSYFTFHDIVFLYLYLPTVFTTSLKICVWQKPFCSEKFHISKFGNLDLCARLQASILARQT
ncbi:hypothetical protein Taro_050876 [Colocasia esculenta]|uniref:Uncharacterized protein n=1 Tax=Colocasia esculenta TaxID=4460 RepID=A0A843XF72_COLES|nr:hypothetical protein [Colocasia esculenta]